jgi:hypothetical protein
MFKGRRKNAAVVAGASVLIAMASLAIVPLSASAVGSAGTTTSVTATPSSTTTGGGVSVLAKVAPVTTNASVPTGTVTFTITGNDSSTVNCKTSNTVAINHAGKATCTIPTGVLLGAASPYSISATYNGDTNFAGSTGSTSEVVAQARTHVKLRVKPPVRNNTANTFTARIKSGSVSGLISGQVRFSVVSAPGPANPHKLICVGGNNQPVAVSGNVATATCHLVSGWFTIPKKTKNNKHPTGSYGVTATYLGNGSFFSSQKTKRGTV